LPESSVTPALCRGPRSLNASPMNLLYRACPPGGSRHKAGVTGEVNCPRFPSSPHFITIVTGAFGTCALIEGEYIASTRVGGRLNVPAPFSRIV